LASVLTCGGQLNSAKGTARCQLGENGSFEGGLKKRFDDHQVSAPDKLFFSLLGFVFSMGDDQVSKVPANA